MAQKFSKPFYNSKEWQTVREDILRRDNYLCVQCKQPAEEIHHIIWLSPKNINDINITLNANNLISLCKDCHFKTHKDAKIRGLKDKYNISDVEDGLMFDENGMLVKIEEVQKE